MDKTDSDERMVAATTFESLGKGLGKRLSDGSQKRLAEIGVDFRKPLALWYPEATWLKTIQVVCDELYPELPPDEARTQMGADLYEGFTDTIAGHVVVALLKALGPKRAFLRTAKNLRNGTNYSQVKITELGKDHYEMWTNMAYDSQLVTRSIMMGGMRTAGARDLRFETTDRKEQEVTFEVQWST